MATPRLYDFDIFGRVMGATPQGGVGGIPSRPSSLYENIVQPTMGTGNVMAPSGPAGTTVPQATGSTASPVTLPSYDQLQPIIDQINASNRQAQGAALRARIPGSAGLEQQRSQAIANLFNPNPALGELDVGGAAAAVGSGTVGSPFAGVSGINRTQNQILARQIAGSNLLNQAYAANPAAPLAEPQALFQQQVSVGQAQRALEQQAREAALDRQLRARLADLEFYNRYAGGRYGGGYSPSIPTSYGRPIAAPTARPTTPSFGINIPEYIPPSGRPGTGEVTVTDVPGGVPENWMDLSPAYQQQYLTGIANNPYYNQPDWMNPYSGDQPSLDELIDLYGY